MHAANSILAGALPHTTLGSSPYSLAGFKRSTSNEEGKRKEKRVGIGRAGIKEADAWTGSWERAGKEQGGEGRKEKVSERECFTIFTDLPQPLHTVQVRGGKYASSIMSPNTASLLPHFTVQMNLAGADASKEGTHGLYFRKKKTLVYIS